MKTDYAQYASRITKFIGQKIGKFTILEIKLLDNDTTLICCKSSRTSEGSEHLEAEHWLTENTFHYNNLSYDHDGNFLDSAPVHLCPQHMRTFERIFNSLSNF